jgi:hypothetical protein
MAWKRTKHVRPARRLLDRTAGPRAEARRRRARPPGPALDVSSLSSARVRYLEAAYEALRAELLPEAPERDRVALAYSFPTKGAAIGHGGRGVIGQCISARLEGSAAGEQALIVIHPSQWSEDLAVLAVLAHEMAHAAAPGAGHGAPFVRLVRRIGLAGKPTATVPGEAFKRAVAGLRGKLPPFPAGSLTILGRRVAGTRLRLFECACNPPIKVRTARDELPWVCEACGEVPQLKDGARAPREELKAA